MNLAVILMIIGIICMIISFFLKDSSKKIENELEELSLSLYQETNALKRRVKLIEEELLLDSNLNVTVAKTSKKKANLIASQPVTNITKTNGKPINKILVQQVIELNKQGYSLSDIKKLSSLNEEQILSILQSNGGNR